MSCCRGALVPTLLETQRALGAALLGPRAFDSVALPLDPLCLAVYRNTCQRSLVNALSTSFPIVARLVGAEFFEGMACAFIERHLPTSACLDDYGAELPAFVETFAPASSLSYLADVARLEWAVNQALHADDAAALDLTRLADLGESELAALTFTMHPSVTLLALRFPADAIWDAVIRRDDAAMAAIDLASGPVHLLIERGPEGVAVRRLSEAAWRFTARLAAGEPLGIALDAGADAIEPLQAVLADHLAGGRFISLCEHCAELDP
jgi:hypothetical protein